jgi:hypothetical protein
MKKLLMSLALLACVSASSSAQTTPPNFENEIFADTLADGFNTNYTTPNTGWHDDDTSGYSYPYTPWIYVLPGQRTH